MSTTYNGWRALFSPPSTYFTAPNGKRVYCANADVATIFEYVARQWHERIEPLPPATCNVGDPCVRTGFIVIHSYRAPNTTIGTGNKSNHRSATGMDINGHLHPYEASNPPHLKGPGYRDGFTTKQRAELRKIQQEIGRARGRLVLRLGIDFAVGLRDGMHVEIAPGVTAQDVKAAAAALRAAEVVIDWTTVHRYLLALGYPATEAGVKAYQKDRGLTVDGRPGKITTAALEADMATIDEVLAALKDNTELTKSAINAAEWGGPKRVEGNLVPRFNAIPAAVADELLARRPDPTDGPRHKRFRYHDVQSQLLYAADGGLAAGVQIAALTAAVKELAANRGVDGDALVAAVTTAADRAASEQAAADVAVDVDQED